MRIAALARIEWIKTTRRFAFWVGFLCYAGIMAIQFGERWWSAHTHPKISFAFPSAWTSITDEGTFVTGVFLVIVLAMLIGGEYAWKTARQNVIDGLSKNQFYAGKVLMWLGVVAAFGLAQIVVGGAFAAAGTPAGSGAWVRGPDLAQVGGVALCLVGLTSLGFFFTFASRSAAAGIGLFFLYLAFGESLISRLIRLLGDGAAAVTHFLPMSLFNRALQAWQWDPAALVAASERAASRGAAAPVPMAHLLLVTVILGWAVLSVSGAYLIFRARDL